MQITLTINETFDNADALADFAAALRQMFAGAAVRVGRSQPVAAKIAAPAALKLDPAGFVGEPADSPAPAASEPVGGDDAPEGAEPAPGKRGRGRPRKEAAPASEAPAEPAAPSGRIAGAVAKIAADAGATVAAPPAEAGEVTEADLRAKLAELFKTCGTKAWVAHLAENGGFKSVVEIVTAKEGETPAEVQARIRRFHGFAVKTLADKAAEAGK